MKRLTERLENGVINVKYASQHESAIHRLVTIEDILGDEYDLDLVQELIQAYREGRYIIMKEPEQAGISRLRELAQADREGRCVVLPAGIGDTAHHITTCKNFSQVLDGTMYGPNGELGTATGLYCPCELAETCPFPCDDDGSFDCEKHKNTLAIFEDVVTGILSDDMQDTLFLGYSGNVAFDDFGKTVFLTREEAEAALRREQE